MRGAAVFLILCVLLARVTDAAGAGDQFRGRLLSEALHTLQSRGLRIVFSSEIVTRELRVGAEPRSKAPLEILQEILTPHGLSVERGPRGVLIVVRSAPAPRRDPSKPASTSGGARTSSPATSQPGYVEQVLVIGNALDAANGGAAAEMTLDRDAWDRAASVLTADPFRALQFFPSVVAADDWQSEFSIRGSPHRQIGVVVDGVATSWLRHAAYGRGSLGSLAMFGPDVVAQASLQPGAHPQRHGDWIGGQLVLTLREGSRTETRVRASIGGINGGVMAEGPLGRKQRGSWLVAARQSYLDSPVKQRGRVDSSVFGFSDGVAKLVYDVRANHTLTITALAGRTGIDAPDDRASSELGNGSNAAGMLAARWDATLPRHLRVSQQINVVSHRFRNIYQNGEQATYGRETDVSYRVDVSRPVLGGWLEAGAQGRTVDASASPGVFNSAASSRSAYVNFGWSPIQRLTIWPGLRVSTSSNPPRAAVGRWIVSQWTIRDGWMINTSAAVSSQFPELSWISDPVVETELNPERAAHLEIAVVRRLGHVRWQTAVFTRSERDVSASAEATRFDPRASIHPGTRLSGRSSGIELLVERRVTQGLSGLAGYSFGKTYYRDTSSGKTFRADFDRRHSLSLSAQYSFTNRTAAAVMFRAGSSLPGSAYVLSNTLQSGPNSGRNEVRQTPYARLDVTAQKTLDVAGRRVTIFAEIINALNRSNMGPVQGQESGEPFRERILPRMALAGLRVEF
jgi:hypothetical protein